MAKITYNNKVALITNPEIANENKITDDDMNEIKQVVNENDDKFLTNGVNIGTSVDSSYNTNLIHSNNLMPYPYDYSTTTIEGITFTDNGDGTITANGTATANAIYYIKIRNEEFRNKVLNKNIILSGCPSGGSSSTYRMQICNYNSDNNTLQDYGTGTSAFTFTNATNNYNIVIQINSGVTVNNIVFKPMVRLSTDSDTSYEPFVPNSINVNGDKLTETIGIGKNVDNDYRINLLKGKNLLNCNGFVSFSDSNTTITTSYTNGMLDYILATKTSSSNNIFIEITRFNFDMPTGTYILNGCPSGGGDTTYTFYFRDVTANTDISPRDAGLGANVSLTKGHIYILYLRLYSSSIFSDLKFYPMLRLTNEVDGTYKPYITPSIVVDNDEIYSKEYVLYDNPAGTNANLTLNDNPYNFNYVEIFFKNSWISNSIRINMNDDIGTKSITMTIPYGTSTNLISIHSSVASITTNAINFDANRDRDVAIGASGTTVATTRQIKITKVIGYK